MVEIYIPKSVKSIPSRCFDICIKEIYMELLTPPSTYQEFWYANASITWGVNMDN